MNVVFGVVGALSAIMMMAVNDAPPVMLVAVGFVFLVVTKVFAVLLATGALAYARVKPHRVTYRPVLGFMPLNFCFAVDLQYGDALVVTEEGLFIWRASGGRYERVPIDPKGADPDDWAALQAWVASIWPQPHPSSYPNAATAARAPTALSFAWWS